MYKGEGPGPLVKPYLTVSYCKLRDAQMHCLNPDTELHCVLNAHTSNMYLEYNVIIY